jgi:RHS repeat-associated protein
MPIEQISGEGKVLYLHHDQQGSTRMLTGSTGSSEGTATYDAYGNPTTAGTATTPLGYDGQYTNTDSGLIYLRARTYDPQTAQFLSVDPAETETGEPYSYAGDNPVNAGDSSGEQVPQQPPIVTADPGTPQQSMSSSSYQQPSQLQNLPWVQNPGSWTAVIDGTRRWYDGSDHYYWYESGTGRWYHYGSTSRPGLVIGRQVINNQPGVWVEAHFVGPLGGTADIRVWVADNEPGVWVSVQVHTAGGVMVNVRVWVRRPR